MGAATALMASNAMTVNRVFMAPSFTSFFEGARLAF
jgi:hypothetical protein